MGGSRATDGRGRPHYGGLVTTALEELAVRLREFAAARDWEQFHTPKNAWHWPERPVNCWPSCSG